MTEQAVQSALTWLKHRGTKVPADIIEALNPVPIVPINEAETAKAIKAKQIPSRAMKAMEYQTIRDSLWAATYDAVYDFLNSNAHVATYARPMATAVSKAYIEAADAAYVEGGGSLPMDEDTTTWARSELDAQLNYVDSLFQTLKALRKEGDADSIHEAFAAAERWASALDGFFNAVKLAGAKNVMLTWSLGGTEKHCKDCLKLDGQRHRASWYSSRGYYPRKPGSATECGGFHCDCSLSTDNGEEFTI